MLYLSRDRLGLHEVETGQQTSFCGHCDRWHRPIQVLACIYTSCQRQNTGRSRVSAHHTSSFASGTPRIPVEIVRSCHGANKSRLES